MSARDLLRARVDPEALIGLDHYLGHFPPGGLDSIPDLDDRRAKADEVRQKLAEGVPISDAIGVEDRQIPGPIGAPNLTVRIYRPVAAEGPLPGLLYVHGGGMIMGSLESDDLLCRMLSEAVGCVVVSVDFRLAPEDPYPAGVEDCYAGLSWMAQNIEELGLDGDRLAIFGISGGGGVAAAAVQIARDRGGPDLVLQMLIYPMLDDRNDRPSTHEILDLGLWDRDTNVEAWSWILGELNGRDAIPGYAAPSRAEDLTGLPPTYIDVGELDLFRDEDVDYAARLLQAGVPTELHVTPGAYHAAELLAPTSALSARIFAYRLTALQRAFGVAPTAAGE